jgi:hypothetical protein
MAMAQEGCTFCKLSVGGMRAVTFANGFVSATILPEKGGDIHSLVRKPRGCLFRTGRSGVDPSRGQGARAAPAGTNLTWPRAFPRGMIHESNTFKTHSQPA